MTRFAAWMDGVAEFDEGLFRLSQAEAGGLDPQCRMLLENTWAAMQVLCCAAPCCALCRVQLAVSCVLLAGSALQCTCWQLHRSQSLC
jgi:hypothetical protein